MFFHLGGGIHRDTIAYAPSVVQLFERLWLYHCGDDDEKWLMIQLWPELLPHVCYNRSELNAKVWYLPRSS